MSAKIEMETDDGKEEAVQTKSQHERNQDEEEQESETSSGESKDFVHPLFMDGLPSDFASNPQLAAIASLMEGGDYKEEGLGSETDIKTMPKEGGGKVRRQHRKHSKKSNPYVKPEKKKKQTSLGEAQLFLNMWKL